MGDGGVQLPPGPHFGLGISLSLFEVPSMFSLSLFLQNGISPGILDKARSLSAYLAKRHFTRHT